MREPPWKALVDQLVDEEYQSVYLDRLRARVDVGQERQSMEREILEEMAHSLAKAENRVNVALLELELLDSKRPGDVEAFKRQREVALRLRRDLLIHREALCFPPDPLFQERYPVPPKKSSA
jgi:hypothetical protein